MGLLVRAAMDGGSGGVLPESTWFGGVEWGLNSSPCCACQAECPSICMHLCQNVCPSLEAPESLAAAHPSRLKSALPHPLLVSGHTHLPAFSGSRMLPTQGLCTCCFLCPGCTPYPTTLPGQLLLHSDFKGIVTSSGKLSPATCQPRFCSLQSASDTSGAFLYHPHQCVIMCVPSPP